MYPFLGFIGPFRIPALLRKPLHVNDQGQEAGGQNHSQTKNLAHCEKTKDKSDLRVRLSEKFDNEAKYAIKEEEKDHHHSVSERSFPEIPQDQEQEQTFGKGLV